jgi:hypothetical protein
VGHLIDPWLTILDAQKVLTHSVSFASEAHSRIETVISSAMQALNGKTIMKSDPPKKQNQKKKTKTKKQPIIYFHISKLKHTRGLGGRV